MKEDEDRFGMSCRCKSVNEWIKSKMSNEDEGRFGMSCRCKSVNEWIKSKMSNVIGSEHNRF